MEDKSAHKKNDGNHDDHHGSDGAPSFPFGEVIPEANWQEKLLVLVAGFTLAGLICLFCVWQGSPLAALTEENAQHAVSGAK
jgi:hypothetical protein